MTTDARTKRFIAQRDRAESKARTLELANDRLKAKIAHMRPVVDAANGWLSGGVDGADLKAAVAAYRDGKAGRLTGRANKIAESNNSRGAKP